MQQHACYSEGCGEPAIQLCDNCDHWACDEHLAQRGGDRQVQDIGAVAYPAICEKCSDRNGP